MFLLSDAAPVRNCQVCQTGSNYFLFSPLHEQRQR